MSDSDTSYNFSDQESYDTASDYVEQQQQVETIEEIENKVYNEFATSLTFSWLRRGFLSDVRDQGKCGSCWTFPTSGSVESKYLIDLQQEANKEQVKLQLSAQQMLDCAPRAALGGVGSKKDEGASIRDGYGFIEGTGLYPENIYPYEAVKRPCRCKDKVGDKYYAGGLTIVNLRSAEKINDAIRKHPLAAVISLTKAKFIEFKAIRDGRIFEGNTKTEIVKAWNANNELSHHAVLLAGYGVEEENGMGYFLCKNSWGQRWGLNGFGRISRRSCFSQVETIDEVKRICCSCTEQI